MSNAHRVFDEVLSVDAWRTEFDSDSNTATVHADVSFLKGKFGDDPDSPVRFEISLKRAEIIFVIPKSEPLTVLQSSVKREKPVLISTESLHQTSTKKSAGIAANLNTSSKPSVRLDLEAKGINEKSEIMKSKTDGSFIAWAQSKNSDGDYRWDLAPKFAQSLLGKAWDAVAEPILSIKLSGNSKIEPVCRVLVRCRKEDLEVQKIEVKEKARFLGIEVNKGVPNKLIAAQAYIKAVLASRDLDVKNYEDPYGEILLAESVVYAGE